MECSGQLVDIKKNWQNDKFVISIEINETLSQESVEKMQNRKLRMILKEWKQKRSLDANGYLWVLCTEIARVVGSSKDEVYEEMLQKYGVIYRDEDGNCIAVTLKSTIDISKVDGHWKFYDSNGKFSAYLMIKGTSEYDTSEMAHFLDMVVEEAKELGIQTETPDEIARMKALWGAKNG